MYRTSPVPIAVTPHRRHNPCMPNQRIEHYADEIAMLDQDLVYEYLIDLGKTLRMDPLGEDLRTRENRVSRCNFALFVAREDGRFKAYSDAIIASGYAAILVDVFNSTPPEQAALLRLEDFKPLKLDLLLSMNRASGFQQMIEIMAAQSSSG